jgi:hypoxanthine-DNA glycosylase
MELKSSFAPIADKHISILILGTLPGEKSLELQEYYAHSRNRFWQVIAAITGSSLPDSYEQKLELLRQNRIGVWDVVQSAKRVGSLDTNILDEIPNDLDGFLENHPHLRTIGFNGAKSRSLFDKYFRRKPDLKYLALPSTSPANASYSLERLCEIWLELLR